MAWITQSSDTITSIRYNEDMKIIKEDLNTTLQIKKYDHR